ncbi:hypothetical protein ART_1614 [Arthrobacter sp. PAMC 25486]|uniref:hypothetical protein n=1 Tax=Arthrobacter sp. PAMC 25486 TaxID=1494608 RepID=UPI000535E6D9|nr:hypothetical protein [Arthrobacter sp. PAMC 25486]AIY01213.1 hypothetical protein ART_1614 [Arthrobacter sp. PAMC 25486]
MAAPKQPQDRKLKAAEADALKAPFEYVGADGETKTLPFFSPTAAGLTSGDLRKNRNNELELLYIIIEALADDAQLESLDALSVERFGEVTRDWQEATGAELPK